MPDSDKTTMASVKCKMENVKVCKEGAVKCYVPMSGKGSPTAILHFTLYTFHSNYDPPEIDQLRYFQPCRVAEMGCFW